MSLAKRHLAFKSWWGANRPIATFLRHGLTILTLGWDFPLVTEFLGWWRSRPRVQRRRIQRATAFRYFGRLVQMSIRLALRVSIKIVTFGKFPRRAFLWDRN
jgi:hypothetical protein